MADLVAVVPMAEDETEASVRRLVWTSKVRDLVFCVDEDYPHRWPERYGHVVRVEGFGVGKALERGFRYAFLDLGAEWVVRTDAHVEFRFKASELCRPELEGYVVHPGHVPAGSSTVVYSLLINPSTWDFSWVTWPAEYTPQSMESTMYFHRRLADMLWRVQGEVFAIPYWGKENLDVTLTLARLGHPVKPAAGKIVIHHYKKAWPEKRVQWKVLFKRWAREPWMSELPPGRNPYFEAIGVSDVIYAFRHYENPAAMPFWSRISFTSLQIAQRYFPGKLRYLPFKPVFNVFRELGFA
jgi:hypothetical protein